MNETTHGKSMNLDPKNAQMLITLINDRGKKYEEEAYNLAVQFPPLIKELIQLDNDIYLLYRGDHPERSIRNQGLLDKVSLITNEQP